MRRSPLRWLVAGVALAVVVTAIALVVGNVQGGVIVVGLIILGAILAQARFNESVAVLVLVAAILVVPARLTVAQLGTGGTLAGLLGLAAFGIWSWGKIFGRKWSASGPQPLRIAMLVVAVAVLASFIAMGFRPHDSVESRSADRGLILLIETLGIALLVADCIPNRARLQQIVRTIVGSGGILAGVGVVEFFTKINLAAYVRIPGFAYNEAPYADERSGFTRIISTASHPIELSVVMAAVLPLALYVAQTCERRARRWWWSVVALLVIALPLTISRTAIAGLVIALVILACGWDGRRRRRLLLAVPVALAFFYVAVPGLIGSLQSLILGSTNDPSITSRQAGYDYVATFIDESPLFGRGWQTFIPTRYQFLDNQFLLGLVEVGLFGVAALLAMLATGVLQALAVRRQTSDPADRELALSLVASIAVSLVSWFTYDALSFPTGRMITVVCVALAAALWRLHRASSDRPAARAGAPNVLQESP